MSDVRCLGSARGSRAGDGGLAIALSEQIKRLPSKEKAEVLTALLRSQTPKRQLSGDELVALADQMVATKDPEEADRLEKEILAGFYGR